MSEKTLTIKEAAEQGFSYYGFESRDWQTVEELHDGIFEEVDEEDWDDLVLFSKKPFYPVLSAEDVSDMIANRAQDVYDSEVNNDDSAVYDSVNEIDFTEITNIVNKELEKHKYWNLTNIKLVKSK